MQAILTMTTAPRAMAEVERRTRRAALPRVTLSWPSILAICGSAASAVGIAWVLAEPRVERIAETKAETTIQRHMPLFAQEASRLIEERAGQMVTTREFDLLRQEQDRRHREIMTALEALRR